MSHRYSSRWEDEPYRRTSGRASPTYNDPVELPPSASTTPPPQEEEQKQPSSTPPPPPPSTHYNRDSREDYDRLSHNRSEEARGRHGRYGGDRHRRYDDQEYSHRRPMDYHDRHPSPGYLDYRSKGYGGRRRGREEFEHEAPYYDRYGGDSYRGPSADRYKRSRRSGSYGRSRRYNDYEEEEEEGYRRGRRYERDDRLRDRMEEEEKEEEEEEVDALQVYQNLITAIGDNGPQAYEKHLNGLVVNIDESDMETYETELVETIIECASQLPHKTPVYGTLAALLNKQFPKSFGSTLSTRVVHELETTLNTGDFTRAKMILRFIAGMCAAHMVSCDDWVQLADTILEMAKTSKDHFIADCYTYSVLGALPWIASTLKHAAPEKLDELITQIGTLTRPSKTMDSTQLTSRSAGEINRYIYEQLNDARESDHWNIQCIPQSHAPFEKQLDGQEKHSLRNLILQEVTTLVAFVRADFDIDNISTDIVPSVDQICLLEMCSDILYFFGSDTSLCAKTLYHLVEYFGPMYKSRSRRSVGHLVVQSICAHLFMQPISPAKSIFYPLLIIRMLPEHDDISTELVATINWLLENAHRLDAETRERVSELFAVQMNYFQFFWDWKELEEEIGLDGSEVKRAFVQQCLHKIEYLSFIHPLANPEFRTIREKLIGSDRSPSFKYTGQIVPEQLLSLFKQKRATVSDVEEILSKISSNDETEKITTLMHVFLMHTFLCNVSMNQHDRAAVDSVMQKMISKDDIDKQKVVIEAIHDFWERNTQKQMLLIHSFHADGLLTAKSIIQWATSQAKAELDRGYLWIIVRAAIDRVVHLLQSTHDELIEKQEQLAIVEKKCEDKDVDADKLATSSPENVEMTDTATSFTGNTDILEQQKAAEKKVTLEKDIESLEKTFNAQAKELDDAFAIFLNRFDHLLSDEDTEEMTDADDGTEKKTPLWLATARDQFSQIVNRYHKLMRDDSLESLPSNQLQSILDKSLYFQRCETLSHISTLKNPLQTTRRDTLLMEKLQSQDITSPQN